MDRVFRPGAFDALNRSAVLKDRSVFAHASRDAGDYMVRVWRALTDYGVARVDPRDRYAILDLLDLLAEGDEAVAFIPMSDDGSGRLFRVLRRDGLPTADGMPLSGLPAGSMVWVGLPAGSADPLC